ncbi:MAG TPA: NUDIX hydrolase [Longimicrobium sp.]|nr:NUDIX hydrolase [Longimicrobium sp.]
MGDARDEAKEPETWERVSSDELGDFDMFRVRRDRARSPRDGSVHDFHVAVSPEGVAVVALTEDGRMVFVEQFRHPRRRVTLELPSGVIDDGEAPDAAALRELREETGYEGERAEIIGAVDLNPSWQVTRVHLAVVRRARPTAGKDEDAAEDTRVRLLDPGEVRRKVLAGEIDSASVVAALALWEWSRGGAPG